MSKSSKHGQDGGHKTLNEAIAAIKKTSDFYSGLQFIRTGVLAIDDLFDHGLPLGKVLEFASREGVGKTTIWLYVSKALCELGHSCLYIDAEFGVTPSQLEGIGLTDHLDKNFHLIKEQRYGAIDDILAQTLHHGISLVVIDSFTALRPRKVAEENIEDIQPGLKARLDSNFLSKYQDKLSSSQCTLILINQMRTKLNFRGVSTEAAAGGNALKFYADGRFHIRRLKTLEKKIDGDDVPYGSDCMIEVTAKNRISSWRKVPITVLFGLGVSNVAYLQEKLIGAGYITQSSAYFKVKTDKLDETVRGREALLNLIKGNYDYLSSLILKTHSEEKIDQVDVKVDVKEDKSEDSGDLDL